MLNRHNLVLAFAVFCATGLYFVDAEQTDVQPDTDVAQVESDTSAPGDAAKQAGQTRQSDAEQEPSDETEADSPDEPTAVAFEPPFPERTNLFQAPKRQGRGQAKSGGQVESAIELLGFVNVNGQRVALSIDGLVSTFAEGDKQLGLEVISIKPPAVVLQRGRQRWQATFDN